MKPMQWTVTVDYVDSNAGPESGWEAAIEVDGDYGPGGYEAGDPAVLLARVAADLRTEVEHLKRIED
jgi:hypothetical protein